MTAAQILARGSGPLDFRLVVEGWPEVFVTDGMTGGAQSDGRTRIQVLTRKGLRWSERQHFVEPIGELRGFRVELTDHDGLTSASVQTPPSAVTYLAQDILTKSATTVKLTSVAGIASGTFLHVGTEVLRVTTTPVATDSGYSMSIQRNRWDTEQQKHARLTGAALREVEITDRPVLMRGRRAWLYAHGPGETGVNDAGTLVWKGMVGDEPRLRQGATWDILLDPLTKVLDQDIGVESAGLSPRGIFYSNDGALWVRIREYTSSLLSAGTLDLEVAIKITGFFETQAAFVDALNTYLTLAKAGVGLSNTYVARVESDGKWTIEVRTPSASSVFATVVAQSGADGASQDNVLIDSDGSPTTNVADDSRYTLRWNPLLFSTITIGEDDPGEAPVVDFEQLRLVPRASYRTVRPPTDVATAILGPNVVYDPAASDAYVYLDGASRLSADDTLSIAGEPFRVVSVTGSSGLVQVWRTLFPCAALRFRGGWFGGERPEFGATMDFNGLDGWATLSDFIDALVTKSAEYADLEGVPFLRSDDFDVAAITSIVAERIVGLPHLQARSYTFTELKSLRAVLEQELLAHGLYLHLTNDWKMSFRPLRAVTGVDHDLTDADRHDSEPTLEAIPDVVNAVEVRTNYVLDDEGKGEHRTIYTVREVLSQTRMRLRRKLEIAPEIVERSPIADVETARNVATPYLTVFGLPYDVVSFGITTVDYDVLVGEVVRMTLPQLPYQGVRRGAFVAKTGIVVGRSWDIATGAGVLDVLVLRGFYGGYAPAAEVTTSPTFVSGTTYDIATTSNKYSPAGAVDASFFEAGDLVRLVELDALDAQAYFCEVVSVTGTTIRVRTPGYGLPTIMSGAKWALLPQDDLVVQASQRTYTTVAGRTFVRAGEGRAVVFGP